MQMLVPAGADARTCITSRVCANAPPSEPYQLSFLSPLPGAAENAYENDPDFIDCTRHLRRRRCRSLTQASVPKGVPCSRAKLTLPRADASYECANHVARRRVFE